LLGLPLLSAKVQLGICPRTVYFIDNHLPCRRMPQ
jgi:hypothetical protein